MPPKFSTRHDPLPATNGARLLQGRLRPGPVRPRTLIAARWIALVGQAAAVVGAWAVGARFPLAPVALVMAAAVVVMLPVLIIYFFAQRYFVQGIALSGVKG